MTEEQLIALVAEKDLDDWSVEEVDALRSRLRDSPRLRQLLLEHVTFEQYLGGMLGAPELSVDGILAAARKDGRGGRRAWRSPWLWLLVVVIVLVGLLVLRPRREIDEPAGAPTQVAPLVARLDPRLAPTSGAASETESDTRSGAEGDAEAASESVSRTVDKRGADALIQVLDRPFSDTAFDTFDDRSGLPERASLGSFLEIVGKTSRLSSVRRENGPAGSFKGRVRLRPRWPEDGVLRLSLFDMLQLRIRFEGDGGGVTLAYLSADSGWAAYRSSERADGRVRLESLLAADCGIWKRTGEGVFELRVQDDEILMTRGDLLILAAPFAGLPTRVFLEGKAGVRGLSLYIGEPAPRDELSAALAMLDRQEARGLFDGNRPATYEWTEPRVVTDAPKVAVTPSIDRLPGGGVRLTKPAGVGDVSSHVLLPGSGDALGLKEVVLRFGGRSAGSGLALGTRSGKPLYRLVFLEEQSSGALTFDLVPDDGRPLHSRHDERKQLVPLCGADQEIHLVLGPDILTCWVSTGRERYGPVVKPIRDVHGLEPFASVGLFVFGGDEARSVTLESIDVFELDALTSYLPASLFDATAGLSQAVVRGGESSGRGRWLTTVLESQPEGVEFSRWVRACAVRTLASGASTRLSHALFAGMVEGALSDDRLPHRKKARLLDQICLVADTWDASFAGRFSKYLVDAYGRLGASSSGELDGRVFTDVHRRLVRAPIRSQKGVSPVSEELIQQELLELVHRGSWEEVRGFCRRARFWIGEPRDPDRRKKRNAGVIGRIEWAEGMAFRHLPSDDPDDITPIPASMQHPLETEFSKEGYNTIAEFDAAIESGAFEDACRIITSSSRRASTGLLPDQQDEDLLVSLQVAVALAMQDQPELRASMQERFGELGRLRVRQAIERHDAAAVEAATVQFYGSSVAVEALGWLGDRALAAGNFSRAVGSYLHAMRHSSAVDRQLLAARLRLVGAIEGHDVGEPVSGVVNLGDRKLSGEQFEALVATLRNERRRGARLPGPFNSRRTDESAPDSGRYRAERIGSFRVKDAATPPGGQNRDIDWISRQLDFAFSGDLVLINERTRISALDVSNGQRRWVQQGSGRAGQAGSWPLESMEPLVVGSRVYTRLLKKGGPRLECLDRDSGDVIWESEADRPVASEPMWLENRVVAVTVEKLRDYVLDVRLSVFDPETGEVLGDHPLSRFRDAWDRQIPCRATSRLDRIVIAVGGSVLCTDGRGKTAWLRRQTWLPGERRRRARIRGFDTPLIVDQRVFVTQASVPALECLDLETGRLLWRQYLPDVEKIVGITDGILVVSLGETLRGLDAIDGSRRWSLDIDGLEAIRLNTDPPALFALSSRALDSQGDRRSPLLVWIDPSTGRETGSWPLSSDGQLRQPDLALGPFVSDGERVTFVAGRKGNRARQLYRLLREGSMAAPAVASARMLDSWILREDEVLDRAARALFPDWTLVSSPTRKAGGLVEESRGVRNVLVTRASRGQPVRFARSIDVDGTQHHRLRLKVGCGPGDRWTLRVRAAGQGLVEEVIDAQTAPQGWKHVDVELASLEGRRIWLTVEQHLEKGQQGDAYWKLIQVVP